MRSLDIMFLAMIPCVSRVKGRQRIGLTSKKRASNLLNPWGGAVVVAAVILAAGCGSGASDDAATPGSPTASVEAPTPIPNPTVTGDRVQSNTGYEARIPSGWRLVPNIVGGGLRGDAYFEGLQASDPNEPPPAGLTIVCTPVDSSTPTELDTIVDEKVEALKSLRREDVTAATRADVGGRAAAQIDYIFRYGGAQQTPAARAVNQSRRDVVFATERCIWSVTLATPEGKLDAYVDVLEAFLRSFIAT